MTVLLCGHRFTSRARGVGSSNLREEDVFGFEVAVQHVLAVQVVQALRQLDEDGHDLLRLQRRLGVRDAIE